jgi:hypothetical protein
MHTPGARMRAEKHGAAGATASPCHPADAARASSHLRSS